MDKSVSFFSPPSPSPSPSPSPFFTSSFPHTPFSLLNRLPIHSTTTNTTVLSVPAIRSNSPSLKIHTSNPKRLVSSPESFPWRLPLHLSRKNPQAIYKIIQKLSWQGKLKEALAVLEYLDHQGICANPTTFSYLIGACIQSKSFAYAERIHAHIRAHGLDQNEFLRNKIVHMYASCGSLESAERELPECGSCNNVYQWNALLRGIVISGGQRTQHVVSVFSKMRELGVEPTEYTFSCLIKGLGGAREFHQGLKAHGLLVKSGLLGSSVLRTSLMDMYFKCGKVGLARQVFDEMGDKDVVAWGALLAGFAHRGLHKEVIVHLKGMVKEGYFLNSVILTTVLPIIGELGTVKLGKELHAYVVKTKDYSEQLFVLSAMIDMYCKCGDVKSGRRVFQNSRNRNLVSWTALISGYVSNGRPEQALRSVIWMQQEGLRPDTVTVATVLPVCAQLRALKQGREIHGYILRNGMLPNVSLSTSLVMMYSKCSVLEYGRRVFDDTERKNVITWTSMMDCFMENMCLYETIDLFRSMQWSGQRPDAVVLSRALRACSELQLLKLGKEVHGHVLKWNFEGRSFLLAEIVKLYTKCREHDKAKLVLDIRMAVDKSVPATASLVVDGSDGQVLLAAVT